MSEHAIPDTPTFPPADLDRRFYAFALDRLVVGVLDGLAALAAYAFLLRDGHAWPGALCLAGAVLLVGLGLAALLGLRGTSPGKAALGLRVVRHGSGTPIGLGPAVLRACVVGLASVPTFGLGVATLAWTALTDRGRQRRGWHDHLTDSIVVDVRPVPVPPERVEDEPRHVVNLTAMRLVPAPEAAPAHAPAAVPTSSTAGPPTAPCWSARASRGR